MSPDSSLFTAGRGQHGGVGEGTLLLCVFFNAAFRLILACFHLDLCPLPHRADLWRTWRHLVRNAVFPLDKEFFPRLKSIIRSEACRMSSQPRGNFRKGENTSVCLCIKKKEQLKFLSEGNVFFFSLMFRFVFRFRAVSEGEYESRWWITRIKEVKCFWIKKKKQFLMRENLKGPVEVREPSYSMCRKIIWEVDFHIYIFLHKNYSDFWGYFLCSCFYFEIWDQNGDVDRGSDSQDGHLTRLIFFTKENTEVAELRTQVTAAEAYFAHFRQLSAANTSCQNCCDNIWSCWRPGWADEGFGFNGRCHNLTQLCLYRGNMEVRQRIWNQGNLMCRLICVCAACAQTRLFMDVHGCQDTQIKINQYQDTLLCYNSKGLTLKVMFST